MTTRVLENFLQKFDFDSLKNQLLEDFELFRQASESIASASVPKPITKAPPPGGSASAAAKTSSGVGAAAKPSPGVSAKPPPVPSKTGISVNIKLETQGPRVELPPSEGYDQCVASLKTDTDFLKFLTAPLTDCAPKGGRRTRTRKLNSRGSSTRRGQRRL